MTRPALALAAALLAAAQPARLPAQGRATGAPAPAPSPAPAVREVALKALKARGLGPATMGGRVSDIALDPADPGTFYVALATGGLMKTTDGGASFQGVFDKEAVASIGAVAVAPSNAKVVYVGTGEANDRNSSGWGAGVYRSSDSGSTFVPVGLKDSRAIARIVVNPRDPDNAYAAVMGDLWGPGGERGLFKTADGGKTWKAVLAAPAPYANRVGCGDVALDPGDPATLYATLYARRRTSWSFASGPAATDGKDLGGIFKSSDAGATWKKLETGLPRGTGRIGLDVFRKNPRIVYAVVQSDEAGTADFRDVRSRVGGVFRSEDAGGSWTRMSPLDPRPFYFSQIRVDPENDQRVYILGFLVHVSEDGGKTFREDRSKNTHPDCHALAIDPRNPKRVLLGTDGGAYQSMNGGVGWEHMNRMAAGEFYHVTTDMSTPYRVCGGLQDNCNWVGPSMTRTKDGILNSDWTNLGGGDGFYCAFDDASPDILYSESQQGEVQRTNLANGEIKKLRPEAAEGQPGFRFHWDSPLIGSRHRKGVLYLAGNRVFRLTERGEHSQLISPDLSSQDREKMTAVGSGAETYGVVHTLAESPLKEGLLWAGTDDGRVWVTETEGQAWTDLTPNLPAAAKGLFMSRIEASGADPLVAYLAVDGHRAQNLAPLAFRTGDGGKTWQSVSGDLPADGPVKVLREDPTNPRVLYAGTEFGLFVSLDRGGHWVKLGELPTVAVDDVTIQPRERDLVVATHGRSLFIIDDIRPLEELTPEILSGDSHLFAPRTAHGFSPLPGFGEWNGTGVYRGENPPLGALITFWVKEYTGEPVKIVITNALDQPVANLKADGTPGLSRLSWDLKPTKDVLSDYRGDGARFVGSGEYKVTLTHGKTKQSQTLRVEIAPGLETR